MFSLLGPKTSPPEPTLAESSSPPRRAKMPAPLQRRPLPLITHCTHTVMGRDYDASCHQCGRQPSCGWVYTCMQDEVFGKDPWVGLAEYKDINELNENDPSHVQLEQLGHSKSIVEQAKNGLYTPQQIELLKVQKQNLRDKIAEADPAKLSANKGTDKALKSMLEGSKDLDALSEEEVAEQDRTRARQTKAIIFPRCNFKVCQRCKPHSRPRAYGSINKVADALEPHELGSVGDLPIADAAVVSALGTKPSSLPRSDTTYTFDTMRTSDTSDSSATTDTWATTESVKEHMERRHEMIEEFYKVEPPMSTDLLEADWGKVKDSKPGLRNNLKEAFKDVLKPARKPSAEGDYLVWPEKGIYGPQTERRQDAAQESDLGLAKVGAIGEDDREDSDSSVYEDVGEGSEGGVSLTEESAETHTPDVITQA